MGRDWAFDGGHGGGWGCGICRGWTLAKRKQGNRLNPKKAGALGLKLRLLHPPSTSDTTGLTSDLSPKAFGWFLKFYFALLKGVDIIPFLIKKNCF